MRKILIAIFTLAISALIMPDQVSASEGSIKLSNSNVSCEGISLYDDNSYRVSMKCSGLVYPYGTELDHYVAWARLDNGNTTRLGDIDRGFVSGNVASSFAGVIVTAESTSSPRRPSSTQVLSGNISPLSFDKSSTTAVATPAPTTAPNAVTSAVQDAANTATASSASVGSVIGKILRSLLIIIGVIIVLVIGASLIFRQRGSVSN